MKKPLDAEKKAILFYSGELLLISIVALVIAILEWTQLIKISERHRLIFNWVTIFGGTWLIIDFLWAIFSKKRQKRVALIDKIIHLPLGIYLVSFDTYSFIKNPDISLFQIGIPIALTYLSVCYMFESIYHYFKPIPGLIDAVNSDEKQGEENNEQSK